MLYIWNYDADINYCSTFNGYFTRPDGSILEMGHGKVNYELDRLHELNVTLIEENTDLLSRIENLEAVLKDYL